jgi:hypothetical protein
LFDTRFATTENHHLKILLHGNNLQVSEEDIEETYKSCIHGLQGTQIWAVEEQKKLLEEKSIQCPSGFGKFRLIPNFRFWSKVLYPNQYPTTTPSCDCESCNNWSQIGRQEGEIFSDCRMVESEKLGLPCPFSCQKIE